MESKNGRQLLRELEKMHGTLRLDKESFQIDFNDDEWDSRVFGNVYTDFKKYGEAFSIDMFESPNLNLLTNAAQILLNDAGSAIENIEVGWTSIPILNACAVRSQDTKAIAMNIRLTNTLNVSNSLYFQKEAKILEVGDVSQYPYIKKIIEVLQNSSSTSFDKIMYETSPIQSALYFKISSEMTKIQLLFVLLHEYGHILLGHLSKENLWGSHPLDSSNFKFFSGSVNSELEADEFALSYLLDKSKWNKIGNDFPLLTELLPSNETIPALITLLFFWFHVIAPNNISNYYKISRSHPHPYDRITCVIKLVAKNKLDFDYDRFIKAVKFQFQDYGNI